MSESARAYFEPRFGYDFSQVRVHSGAKAVGTAKAVNARAFTLGQDVVFGAKEYSPDSSLGRRLLAHELTHVVQQKGGHADRQRKRIASFPLSMKNYFSIQRYTVLVYTPGDAFSSKREAEKEIGPSRGPRYYINPQMIIRLLKYLIKGSFKKSVVLGHISGINARVDYWKKVFPGFESSKEYIEIVTLNSQLATKLPLLTEKGAVPTDPIKRGAINVPAEPASVQTWKQWLIQNKSKKLLVIASLINKANTITEKKTGMVSKLGYGKSRYNDPFVQALVSLSQESKHRIYIVEIAKALWGSGAIKAEDIFRQSGDWYSQIGYVVFYDHFRNMIKPMAGIRSKGLVHISARAATLTSTAMEKVVKKKQKSGPGGAQIRMAFYSAVKDLVKQTKSAKIAVGFLRAMADVMVSNFTDANIAREVPNVHRDIRNILKSAGVSQRSINMVRDAYTDVINEKTKLMSMKIHQNAAEVRYIKLYIAIREAVREVGEKWIEKRTGNLRKGIQQIASARTWVSRGVNVAWASCPGPNFAIPVVIVGTIADIFMEMEQTQMQKNLAAYEQQLRSILQRELNKRLSNISMLASKDFRQITSGKLPSTSTLFKSITEIKLIYVNELSKQF